MGVGEKRFLYFSVCACFFTGLFIFILHTFFSFQDDFGVSEHSWLDEVKTFHYIVAPFLLVSFGLLWKGHIALGVRNKLRPKQRSGWVILFVMAVLVFSGQMLLSLIQTDLREWVGWVHLGAGVLITTSIFYHAFKRK